MFGGTEILHIVDAVARDKGISKEDIIHVLEEAVSSAARRKYGASALVKASINRNTGAISLYRNVVVVKDDEDLKSVDIEEKKISLSEALKTSPQAKEGDVIKETLPPLEMARLNSISAKRVIVDKIRELERDKLYEDFKNRVGDIVNGVVEKIESKGFIIKIAGAEAILKKDQALKIDRYNLGDRVKACLLKLDRESHGPMIILTRISKDFVSKLFQQEVPEIYDKIIEIKDVARDPGSRTKISVFTADSSIDPVGSCVGVRGSRVQNVIKELKGEKIDIVKWSENPATYAVNALSSIEVLKVLVDEEERKMEVIVKEDDQSKAIGRRGQNVKLISDLLKWKIDVVTEEEESSRRQENFSRVVDLFIDQLDIDEILAQLLVSEGFNDIEAIAFAEIEKLSKIDGLDEEIAKELMLRANDSLSQPQNTSDQEVDEDESQEVSDGDSV